MKVFSALLFSALASAAAIPPTEEDSSTEYDAIIVGGGPSGLSALSGLARVRRKVLLIDSGEYRNAPTRHMHDVLGFDGVTPAYYRWAAREQISFYDTVSMINGTVSEIKSISKEGENSKFSVITTTTLDDNNGESKNYTARKIVLGTGLKDLIPDTKGLQENWGKGIYWCPWCDGHEHADQPFGFLAPLNKIAGNLREMITLNQDFIAFVNGTDTEEVRALADEKEAGDWEAYLRINNVKIENRTISEIKRLKDGGAHPGDPSLPSVAEFDEFLVEFTEGPPVTRAAFLADFANDQRSTLGEKLGVNLTDNRLTANFTNGMITNVAGVYAVGDANSDMSTNVPHALFSGKRSAVSLHITISREDQATEVAEAAASKRDSNLDERELWNLMNEKRGDLLYAGEFDDHLL